MLATELFMPFIVRDMTDQEAVQAMRDELGDYDALAAKTSRAVDHLHALAGELRDTEAALAKTSEFMSATVEYYSFHQPQVLFVHRTEHHINAAFAPAGGSLVWIPERIQGHKWNEGRCTFERVKK